MIRSAGSGIKFFCYLMVEFLMAKKQASRSSTSKRLPGTFREYVTRYTALGRAHEGIAKAVAPHIDHSLHRSFVSRRDRREKQLIPRAEKRSGQNQFNRAHARQHRKQRTQQRSGRSGRPRDGRRHRPRPA